MLLGYRVLHIPLKIIPILGFYAYGLRLIKEISIMLHPLLSYPSEVAGITEAALDILLGEIERHPIFKNPYFDFLCTTKWNKNTYELHRANFFYRTELTVKAIAHVCSRAAAQEDQNTLILFSHILNEECGNGRPSHCHAVLMEQAHNLFGQTEFALTPLLIKEAKNHPLIIPETQQYRDKLQELTRGSYQCMLGALMFLETHAEKMLRICREAFRASHRQLDLSEYKRKVEIYFNCHLENGVEERHSQDAKQCVLNNYCSNIDLAEIKYGAEEALKAQLNMWNGLYKKVVEIQTNGTN
jgi:hypothetical protein